MVRRFAPRRAASPTRAWTPEPSSAFSSRPTCRPGQTGLRYATINDLYTGRRKPNLDTLRVVLEGLEQLTGQPVEITDLLEVVRAPALHGDPDRPALDLTNLKTFRRTSTPVQPSSPTDSAATVASLRGRGT